MDCGRHRGTPRRATQALCLPGRPVRGALWGVMLLRSFSFPHTLNQRASVLRSARYSCSSLLQSHAQECRKIQNTIVDEPSDAPTRKLLDLWRAGGQAAAHGFAAGCSSRQQPAAVSAAARNPAARQPAQAAQEIDISSDGAAAGAGAGNRHGAIAPTTQSSVVLSATRAATAATSAGGPPGTNVTCGGRASRHQRQRF